MIVFPNSKINLGIYILSKREDGYHTINSCLYPMGWSDALEVLPSNTFSFHNTGLVIDGNTASNMCIKAYELLKKDYDLPPVQIHLHKVIPMGAGLGGGSSDGAFMLKLLNDLFKLKLDEGELITYASQLGSDCAFFVKNKPVFVTGKGDELNEINISLKGKWIIVIYPAVHSSTKEAYEGLDLRYLKKRTAITEILKASISNWKDHLTNDFEKTIFSKYPVLSEIKNQLYNLGAIYASMSGSGSSIYGIFDKEINLKNNFSKDYMIWTGALQ